MALKLVQITELNDILAVIDKTRSILDAEYRRKNLGGWKGISTNAVKRGRCPEIKHVVDDAGNLAACAVYDNREGGSKISGIAGVHTHPDYLEAVALIIKSDISNFDKWYWVEASGAIEHMFKENNGYPIPFQYAKEYLECDIISECPDGFHYIRRLGNDGEVTKGVFGFNSQAEIDLILSEFKDYDEFRKKINATEANAAEIKWAKHVVFNTEEMYSECDLNELPPKWFKDLQKSERILRVADEEEWADSAAELMDMLPVLKVIHVPG